MAAEAGRRGAPRTMLEQLLRALDRTYDEVAAQFEAVAGDLGERVTISSRHLRRLASGERHGTTPATRRVLQAMFGRPVDELLAACPQEDCVASRGRDAIRRPPSGTDKEILEVAAQRARKFALLSGQATMAEEALEQVHDDVHQLSMAYPQQPLPGVLDRLVDTQDTVFTLLERRTRPAHARQLYFLAGVLGGLLAKASHDLADPHLALTQTRTAFLCADQAEHNGLRAWVRGLQSLVAYWSGRPHEAVRYAQSGCEFAASANNTTAVWLPISEARAWAVLGRAEETRAAIRRAEEAWDRVQPDDLDELGGLCTFGRSRQLYYAADALAWLPAEVDAAEDYSSRAVAAYADIGGVEWSFGDQAGSHADLAIARITRRELDGAAEAVEPVLDLPPEKRNHGIVVSARRVRDTLLRSTLADESAELQERIEMFMRTPVAAAGR